MSTVTLMLSDVPNDNDDDTDLVLHGASNDSCNSEVHGADGDNNGLVSVFLHLRSVTSSLSSLSGVMAIMPGPAPIQGKRLPIEPKSCPDSVDEGPFSKAVV